MGSLSDRMLGGGCVKHIGAVHGETVQVLEGLDAGVTFAANIIEIDADVVVVTELGDDPRPKRMLRFDQARAVPRIQSQARVMTEDGKTWMAVRQQFNAYLTVDFELQEVAQDKDT